MKVFPNFPNTSGLPQITNIDFNNGIIEFKNVNTNIKKKLTIKEFLNKNFNHNKNKDENDNKSIFPPINPSETNFNKTLSKETLNPNKLSNNFIRKSNKNIKLKLLPTDNKAIDIVKNKKNELLNKNEKNDFLIFSLICINKILYLFIMKIIL